MMREPAIQRSAAVRHSTFRIRSWKELLLLAAIMTAYFLTYRLLSAKTNLSKRAVGMITALGFTAVMLIAVLLFS
ncbi:MAG: hypothetical protein IJ060_05390 [Oscillospiraceae bacterium]|nr:hypothetical protein [Oscillospiraceae bacterium]